jgi:hypothetical protein
MSGKRDFAVYSCIIDGAPAEDNDLRGVFRGSSPASAARKAANMMMRRARQDEPAVATITILEVTEGSPRKTFSYEAERKRARNHSVNFHGAAGGRTIRFLWTMNLRALSLKERFRSWLTVYPENTKEAWARRPQHDANDSAVAKCLFSARTRERILRRQLLHTGNALTKVLPHEIVLRIVEQMEEERRSLLLNLISPPL